MAAPGAEVASNVPSNIFRAFGSLAGQPPLDAVSAEATVTFTAVDNKGYTVPALTPVGMTTPGSSDNPVGFWTLTDAVIPAGSTTVDTLIYAVTGGADGSNLSQVVRTDSLSFISSVLLSTVNQSTQGGQDAELDDAYLDRLSQELETWSETPILGRDFALIARKINGVWRVGYIDNYNPADGTYTNDKMVALCPIDENGVAVSSAIQTDVKNLMESLREVNFVCNLMTPTVSTIDVTYTAHVDDPNAITQTQTDINSALSSYFNPATWGIQQTQTGEVPVWNNNPNIRYDRVISTILSVQENITWLEVCTISIPPGAMGTADLVMPGAFTLPQLGTVTPTVVSP
jgi:hypothetical protein